MNKIISMSVWGEDPRYIIGAKRQIELAKKFYPDWKVRIYTDKESNLSGLDAEVYQINNGSFGMFWRFYPMFESDDTITMVRDADSRITIRESLAVKEWLDSDKKFHTFRDHDAHYEFPIIGCAFALKGSLPYKCYVEMDRYQMQSVYLMDQFYLRDVVWPEVKDNAMIHSMKEGWFGRTRVRLINPYSFCGNGYDEKDMPLYPPTLEECVRFSPAILTPEFKFDEGILIERE